MSVALWGSAAWRGAAVAWLDERLAEAGAKRTGEAAQPHLRPWATALRVPTTAGVVWLKAAGPGTAFEVGLYEVLHRVAPDRVLPPIATDTDRGWLVLPDGGATVGDTHEGADLVEAMLGVLPRYGQLQRDLSSHVDELLALGVADMRPEALPERYEKALGLVDGALRDRLVAARDTFADWCDRLAAAPGASSLDHNDLHPWNVFAGGRFYDWGDSVVAHPFASLLVPLQVMEDRLGVGPDDPVIHRLRDAYLEPFTDLAPRADLTAAADLAPRAGRLTRALVWQRVILAMGADVPEDYAGAPAEYLGALADDLARAGHRPWS